VATTYRDPGGIRGEFRGYCDSAPRTRFHADGTAIWEFAIRLIDEEVVTAEHIVIRVPDRRYATLERWARPGRQLYVRGLLRLIRWTGSDHIERARLLMEPVELMPLDERVKGSEPAALDYESHPRTAPTQSATRSTESGGKDWTEAMRAELEEAASEVTTPTRAAMQKSTSKRVPRTAHLERRQAGDEPKQASSERASAENSSKKVVFMTDVERHAHNSRRYTEIFGDEAS
jgi:hypothetical protein